MKIEDSKGYKKLLESVMKDVRGGQNCFSAAGCNFNGRSKCSHRYCDKLKWALDRANHYAEKTGLEAAEILNAWEGVRLYWYMNYYQDANQPLLTADHVRVFETQRALLESVGKEGFRCPVCRGISKNPYKCDTGLEMSKGKICDWKVYGLFRDLGKGVFVFVKDKMHGELLFMPVAWEQKA
jgi:hypothetical protein